MAILNDIYRARNRATKFRKAIEIDGKPEPEKRDLVRPTTPVMTPGGDRVFGMDIIVLPPRLLPRHPDHKEDGRRIVRHGLTDVLAWLGEDVGPRPGEPTHAFITEGGAIYVSREFYAALRISV